MKNLINIIFALLIIPAISLAGDLPDPQMTPGAIDKSVTQENIQETVCVKGYTKTVRPPANYTNKLKKSQLIEYGFAHQNPKHYEEDHLIPLSIGGAPEDPLNLWPQTRLSEWDAAKKDVLELRLYKMVCNGEISLDDARQSIAKNWIDTYKIFINSD